jgi:3-hydroxy-4-methylanthranilate adenylyltransferase
VPVPVTGECALLLEPRDRPLELPGEICIVQVTSGSTGQPKIIGRTAGDLSAELDRYAAIEGMPCAQDRLLLLCSPVHTWGLIGGVLHGLATSTPVLFPAAMHGAALMQTASDLGATAIFGVPVHFDLISGVTSAPPLARLRIAVSAGGRISTELTDRFEHVTGCRLGHVYGLTETGVVTADLAGEYPPPATGRPVKGLQVRVAGGQLQIRLDRSPYLVEDGVQRFTGGWLQTFDRAELDEDSGVLRILGRADSVVSIGGLKVDLAEVEQAVSEHPQVTAAVVTFDEVIELHAAVTGDLTAGQLAAWCGQRLSSVKVPKRYYLGDRILTTTTGKVIRDRAQLVSAHALARAKAGRDRGST